MDILQWLSMWKWIWKHKQTRNTFVSKIVLHNYILYEEEQSDVGFFSVDLKVPIFTARNEVGSRLCFYTCLWFCSRGGGGGISACIAGFQAHIQGEVEWAGQGVSKPTSNGEVKRSGLGGSPGPHPMGSVSQHALRQTPRQLLLRAVRILLECILVVVVNLWISEPSFGLQKKFQ